MDTLSHGLWGGAVFGQKDHQWKWAFLWGMCPDLFSFGPFFLTHFPAILERWRHHQFGHPDHRMIPSYVYQAYHVTHSLVTWAVLMTLAVLIYRRRAWPMAAWGLHILCDIPTHSTRFFPTPYLWPFETPYYDGIPWARKSFMVGNYLAILGTYLALLGYRKWKTRIPATLPSVR